MDRRRLGSFEVSPIAFGAWAAGGRGWGEVDDTLVVEAMRASVDAGVNAIDTAPIYGTGHSEELVGRAIQGYDRANLYVATKTAISWDESGEGYQDGSPEAVRRGIEDSLRRLGTDYVDLLQVHRPDPKVPVERTAEALNELYERGVIRAIGVSNYDEALMERHMSVAPLHALQPPYSVARDNRGELERLLLWCRDRGVDTLVYSPLQKGLLTGKYRGDETFPEGDVRRNDKNFQGERFRRLARLAQEVGEVGRKYNRSAAQTVVNWTLGVPGVTVALVGAKTPEQARENAGSFGWELSPEDRARIAALVEEYNPTGP